jgi:uncharacterized protein YjbJ (UPF0337 family)
MTDQGAKGAVNTGKGTVNEGVGKLTGDQSQEAKGKVQKLEGKARSGLGDVQGRGRWRPVLVSAVGAVIVLAVAGLLTGSLRIARNPG